MMNHEIIVFHLIRFPVTMASKSATLDQSFIHEVTRQPQDFQSTDIIGNIIDSVSK